jgi:hypothetical protein
MVHLLGCLILFGVFTLNLVEFGAIIFHVKLDSAKFNDVSSAQFVIEVILGRFGVSDNHKHFVVHVLVWNCISFLISRGLSDNSIVLNLELPVVLPHDNHRFCCLINFFRLSPDGHKLNIVIDSENFSASLSFDIFLGNILGFIVEKSVRVSGPCDTAHVDFILGSLQDYLSIFGRSLGQDLLHVLLGLESVVRVPTVFHLHWRGIYQTVSDGRIEMAKALSFSFGRLRFIVVRRRLLSLHSRNYSEGKIT